MTTTLFDQLGDTAAERAYRLCSPTRNGKLYCAPLTRADALRAADELEAAAILWGCSKSRREAEQLRTAPTVEA